MRPRCRVVDCRTRRRSSSMVACAKRTAWKASKPRPRQTVRRTSVRAKPRKGSSAATFTRCTRHARACRAR